MERGCTAVSLAGSCGHGDTIFTNSGPRLFGPVSKTFAPIAPHTMPDVPVAKLEHRYIAALHLSHLEEMPSPSSPIKCGCSKGTRNVGGGWAVDWSPPPSPFSPSKPSPAP